MIHLLGLVLVSPMCAVLISSTLNLSCAAFIVSDCDECGFNDLGKLLFGGLAAAILVGIAISVIVRKRKDSRAQTSEFVSIRETDRKR
jgi:Na+-translocating ferredoxin:NAD+ oxidoreductase RnfD subunit